MFMGLGRPGLQSPKLPWPVASRLLYSPHNDSKRGPRTPSPSRQTTPPGLSLAFVFPFQWMPVAGGSSQVGGTGRDRKSLVIDGGPRGVTQVRPDIRSGENSAPETWRRPQLRKPFLKKIKLSKWVKHMFLILVKCLFSLEKTCFKKMKKKINIWQNNLFYKCPWVRANENCSCYQAGLCSTPAFCFSFFSLYCVYNGLLHRIS